jgi:hypothetical protein
MVQLITKYDLDGYKYIADSVRSSSIWPQFVSEAQMLDVKPWLGDALLNELVTQESTNPSSYSALNLTLLNGGSYVYQTHTYLFQGLKACIMYYAFGRFTNRSSFNYTAAGIVVKDSDLSTPVSDKVIQRLETESRLTAEAIKDEITLYLTRNYASYPLWQSGSCGYPSFGKNRPFIAVGD